MWKRIKESFLKLSSIDSIPEESNNENNEPRRLETGSKLPRRRDKNHKKKKDGRYGENKDGILFTKVPFNQLQHFNQSESEFSSVRPQDVARKQMLDRVKNKITPPDVPAPLRESPLFPRIPVLPRKGDNVIIMPSKTKGAKTFPLEATSKSLPGMPELDKLSVRPDFSDIHPIKPVVSQKKSTRHLEKAHSTTSLDTERREGIKNLESFLNAEEKILRKEDMLLKFRSRPLKCSWTVHPVYKWEAPNFFKRAFLPSVETLENLLNKQVLTEGQLSYLLGNVRASHFGSDSNPGFFIISGIYIWVTNFEETEQILSRKLRLKLEFQGVQNEIFHSEDVSLCVYQLSKVDHALIGRVHRMQFPNKETELKTDLKCETNLKSAESYDLAEQYKKGGAQANETRRLRKLSLDISSERQANNSGSGSKKEDRTIKIDVTKIFCRNTKNPDVQLWVTLEQANSKRFSQMSYVKFKGVQFFFEKAVNKMKINTQ